MTGGLGSVAPDSPILQLVLIRGKFPPRETQDATVRGLVDMRLICKDSLRIP